MNASFSDPISHSQHYQAKLNELSANFDRTDRRDFMTTFKALNEPKKQKEGEGIRGWVQSLWVSKSDSAQTIENQQVTIVNKKHQSVEELLETARKQVVGMTNIVKALESTSLSVNDRKDLTTQLAKLEYDCDVTMLLIMAARCDALKVMIIAIGNKGEQQGNFYPKLTEAYSSYQQQISSIATEIKEIRRFMQTSVRDGVEFNKGPITLSELFRPLDEEAEQTSLIDESWQFTAWGRLLLPSATTSNSLKSNFGLGFATSLNKLKSRKREDQRHLVKVEDEISNLKAQLTEKKRMFVLQTPGKAKDLFGQQIETLEAEIQSKQQTVQSLTHEIFFLKKSILQAILLRSNEVIGEKQTEKNRLSTDKKGAADTLSLDIEILKNSFSKNIVKYQKICLEEKKNAAELRTKESLFWKWTRQFTDQIFVSVVGQAFVTPADLRRNYLYALQGYNMIDGVTEFLNGIPEESKWQDVVIKEIHEFMKWSDTHPWTASKLAADIALTYSMLIGKGNAKDAMVLALTAKASTTAFLAGLRDPDYEEPVESKEHLKYRALADLCRYVPISAGLGVGMVNFISSENWSALGLVKQVGQEVAKAAGVQLAVNIVPNEYADIAMTAAQIIRGDDYRQILDQRTQLATIELAGTLKDVVMNPATLVYRAQKAMKIWWRSLFESKGNTKTFRILVQVALPTVTVVAAVGTIGIATLATVLSLGAALPIALAILAGGWALYQRAYTAVNWYDSETLLKIEADLKKEEREQYRAVLQQQVSASQELKSLKARYLTSFIPMNVGEVTVDYRTLSSLSEPIQKDILNQLNLTADSIPNKTPGSFTKIFREHVTPQKIKERIQDSQPLIQSEELKEAMVATIYNNLLNQWLDQKIEDTIIDICVTTNSLIRQKSPKEVEIERKAAFSQQHSVTPGMVAAAEGNVGLEKFVSDQISGYSPTSINEVFTDMAGNKGFNRPLF